MKNKNNIFIIVVVILSFLCTTSFSQNKKEDKKNTKLKVGCIAFYNVENLFDTIDDPEKNDEEFLPNGKNKWNTTRYYKKIENLSTVISQIGNELVNHGPDIIGLCEIENKTVLEDLIKSPKLSKLNYGIVHYDSPYERGVDCALLYRKDVFKVTYSKAIPFINPEDPSYKTRDHLVVAGIFDDEKIYFIVNHWPSRRGGEKKSAPLRAIAAQNVKKIHDSIIKIEPDAKIIIMGDLNDDPVDESITKHLGAKGDIKDLQKGDLFNPMVQLYKQGIGTLAYQDRWNLFDQFILSYSLIGDDKKKYKFVKAKVFNKSFLQQQEGNFKGYPFRTYVGNNYQGGYSDHFPSYIFIAKEVN